MAALEEPPHRGQAVRIFSRSSGGWINATVEAVDGEEATVLYIMEEGADGRGREMRKVVDWDDPVQLIMSDQGLAAGPRVATTSPPPAASTTWAASSGAVFDPDDDDYGELNMPAQRGADIEAGDQAGVVNPMAFADDDTPTSSPAALDAANGTANGGFDHGHSPAKTHVGALALELAPAPSPDSLMRKKPASVEDTGELLLWMKDMIENQHKDIAELRDAVKQSVANGGGMGATSMMANGMSPVSTAHVDDTPQSRESLIEFIHRNPVFAGATGINPEEKENFIEMIAGRLERRFYYKDSMIIRKGTEATEMFFIFQGLAEVYLDHPDTAEDSKIPPVAKLSKGTFFGEAALLSEVKEVRNAWIRAQCDMEAYVLTADDLKAGLEAHPAMAMLFNAEKHRRATEREEHLERFANGGGNFRRGFKVRLRTLGSKEKLAAQVAQELQEAFETVPEVFPRSAVEALLLDKLESLEAIRDQLAAKGITEEAHGHGVEKPMTPQERKKVHMQMTLLAGMFFAMCFIPYVSVQHHSEEVLLATSASHPALLHINFYSEYRVDVKATVEGQPHLGIKQTSPDAGAHGRRLQERRNKVKKWRRMQHGGGGEPADGALPECTDSCDTANNGLCEEIMNPEWGQRAPHGVTLCADATDTRDCARFRAYAEVCRMGWMDEADDARWRREEFSTLKTFIVRCDHSVAEQIAYGRINMTQAMLPETPRDAGVQLVDEGQTINIKDEAQVMHVEFGMDGDMRNINHDIENVYLLVITSSVDPIAMTLQVNDLGFIGPMQEFVAFVILVCVFSMIVFEVVHHTLAAMIGSFIVLLVLALQHRMPEIGEVIGWMDHGTLALLWGMMIIVGVTAKTGVFEFVAVRLYKVSDGKPFYLLFLLAMLDIVLSAFLDNVTTMLLLAPVAIQLCEAVGRDPRPYLMSLALFGNVGGTMTMIGDPPNIIIGNMMKEFVTFNDFIIFLAPGVIISLPTSFVYTRWYFEKDLGEKMEVNVDQLLADNPIRNEKLLIKTGAMLTVVILGFFMHPITHIDPVWVAIPGAIVIFALDNHHDVEEALHGVEWDTLIFFAALFVMVEGLAEMGLLRLIGGTLAVAIENLDPEARQQYAIVMVCYVSAIAAAITTVPFTTTMIPIIRQIAGEVPGVRIEPLIWSLAFGSCLGGMGTLIGASDNVVMAGIAEKAGFHVSFMSFMKVGFPFMLQSVTICTVWLLFLNGLDIWPNCDLEGRETWDVCIEEAAEEAASMMAAGGEAGGHGR